MVTSDAPPKNDHAALQAGKDVTRNLAMKVCAHSRSHTAGCGIHDAYAWGSCSDHERIVAETLSMLRSLGATFPPEQS